ncbi:MAG: hypothetical protein J6D23_00660, partial [Clostridia bacterium]|nr:hypothetical protein [Clostridia bacterium]
AKLLHHEKILTGLTRTVSSIIDNLEMNVPETDENAIIDAYAKLDYHLAFCSGENNKRFYSIINSDFLDAIYDEGGKK